MPEKARKKLCPGTSLAAFEAGTNDITWHCSSCGDGELIQHWQRTLWDKGGRPELATITCVTYRHGLVDDDDLEDLTGLIGRRRDLQGIVVAIYDNQLLGAAGEYGDPLVGDPLEYDELTIEHAGGTTRIGLYNPGIMLLTTNEEFYKQVHRVCDAIQKAMKVT